MKRTLGKWVQAFFWAIAATTAIYAVLVLNAYTKFDEYWYTYGTIKRANLDSWIEADDLANSWLGLVVLFSFVNFVLLCNWMFKAHRATQLLGVTNQRWSRGWTMGGWFIPGANLIIPRLVIGEIEKAAAAPQNDGQVDPDWRDKKSSPVGWLWWIFWLAGIFLIQFSDTVLPDFSPDSSFQGAFRTSVLLSVIGALLCAAGAALGAMYLRSIQADLSMAASIDRPSPSKQEDEGNTGTADIDPAAHPKAKDPKANGDIADSLRQLKALHDEGILTDDEYETKRKSLAEQL